MGQRSELRASSSDSFLKADALALQVQADGGVDWTHWERETLPPIIGSDITSSRETMRLMRPMLAGIKPGPSA